jgi:hypothetical protein
VLDHVDARLEAAALVERGHLQAFDLDAKLKLRNGSIVCPVLAMFVSDQFSVTWRRRPTVRSAR